ncbi:NUDIX domain-containing protein [Rossellomorea arthrocnemi]|jgi:ADP-ribose pyrophosphatase YjhB (NUDIX family)|uniref:NUDIX domain-containing protein n=1 Tax=Rossellomorea arthrocnemi TaxID=2769542 RepID=UPI0019182843|nr:NUDIX hydrolase [Rossellomorea arthrocnemi]
MQLGVCTVKRGKVWLAVAGLVIDENGKWLVVKKKYSGLKGMWSLPAGFVNAGETVDEAVIREVKEETGLDTTIKGIVGVRSGVLQHDISDNMMIFLLENEETSSMEMEEAELWDVQWKSPQELLRDEKTSVMVYEMIKRSGSQHELNMIEGINPGTQFAYTQYRLFL